MSCSSAETTVGANVKGSENRKVSPNTRETKEDVQFTNSRKTGNLRKFVLASKVVNLFTRAHAPPFIGRRRDFYVPKIPFESREYTNIFYIS
jgi:hypothetical protein